LKKKKGRPRNKKQPRVKEIKLYERVSKVRVRRGRGRNGRKKKRGNHKIDKKQDQDLRVERDYEAWSKEHEVKKKKETVWGSRAKDSTHRARVSIAKKTQSLA